jgi:hypothetical protein
MKHAFSSLCSSDAIAFLLGSSHYHRGCLTGLAFGSRFSACSTSSLGTPSMSEGHQVKISQCSWRNSTSTLSYVGSKFTAMEVVLLGSVGWIQTFLESCVAAKAWSGRDRPTLGSTLWSVRLWVLHIRLSCRKFVPSYWILCRKCLILQSFPVLWWLWEPRITHPKYPICIQFTIPWSVCREPTYPSW